MDWNEALKDLSIGLPEDIRRRKEFGDFDGAIRLMEYRMADPATPQALKNCLAIQKIICKHLPEEFPYSKEDALALVRNDIPDFSEEEFLRYVDERRVRWIYVKGEMRFFNRFYSSLLKTVPGLSQRAQAALAGAESATAGSAGDSRMDISMKRMKANGAATNRIRIRATVRLKDEYFASGMFLRVHLPIPAACQQQTDIRIEAMFPENGVIAPADAPQRTVCWETVMETNQTFLVEYSYLHTASFTDAYHLSGIESSLNSDLQEQAPHIVFSPYIRALCQELTQGLTDPMEKARAFYDFITQNMCYTYMPSYYLLEDIAGTCARDFTGDCGVFALLFITLCRCAGIPAQWQSGMTAEPDFVGSHDWARFYVEPYGWMFADPSYGTSAARIGNEERRRFYFGNLDPYRMVANSMFQENFTIPKQHFRADPYDNQSGEMETTDRGFTFAEYDCTKEILVCQEM